MCNMDNQNLEKALKQHLKLLDKKLQRTESLRAAGWVGSMVSAGLVLAATAERIPVIAGIAIAAAFLNIMATHLVSKKK